MTMILQLVVAAMAVGLTVAEPPQYIQNLTAVKEAADIMKSNLLSMEGNIPLLNDSRRQYAEIVHVIYYSGVVWWETYPERLNKSAPESLNNPELVIDEIKDLTVTVEHRTSQLIELFDDCEPNDDTEACNELIDYFVRHNKSLYGPQADILFAAGDVANELKKRNDMFEEVSRNLDALMYLITTPEDLTDIVEAVRYLFQILWPIRKTL